MCSRALACLSSKRVRRVTTSRRCARKLSSMLFRPIVRGWPRSIESSVAPKLSWKSELCAYKLFRTTAVTASRLVSTTARMPSRLDSSRRSEMPSSRFSFTSSAMPWIARALLTWYGTSRTTIVSLPVLSLTSTSILARMRMMPRPVS